MTDRLLLSFEINQSEEGSRVYIWILQIAISARQYYTNYLHVCVCACDEMIYNHSLASIKRLTR